MALSRWKSEACGLLDFSQPGPARSGLRFHREYFDAIVVAPHPQSPCGRSRGAPNDTPQTLDLRFSWHRHDGDCPCPCYLGGVAEQRPGAGGTGAFCGGASPVPRALGSGNRQEIQHIDQVYLEATVWHRGDTAELRIGGKVQLQGDNGRPAIHSYECLSRNVRVIRVDII